MIKNVIITDMKIYVIKERSVVVIKKTLYLIRTTFIKITGFKN